MPPSTVPTTNGTHDLVVSDGIVNISAHGDLILNIEHENGSTVAAHRFRVSTASLSSHSRYFAGLLQNRFGESAHIASKHDELKTRYGAIDAVPLEELPVVDIKDIGRISKVKSTQPLCMDFLLILHDKDTLTAPPVGNLANIAVVADRFDALDTVRAYVHRKKIVRALDGKTTAKVDQGLTEEKVRQRLLVAALLDYPPWLEKYSARMITRGWMGKEPDIDGPLWWDLPMRLEDELAVRREYILDTIQSTLLHFIAQYTSRERQCRLGYDSSAACDSYQLGEMMRFLSRIGTLRVQGTIFDAAEPPEPYTGDIHALIESLRQVPEYQIDRNHTHCGIRTRLMPILDIITDALQYTGVCADCWSQNRLEYAWTDAKRPLLWKRQSYRSRGIPHKEGHAQVKALFLATERHWA